MSNPFSEFERECGPLYDVEAVRRYYKAHEQLPWLAYANAPTNPDGSKNYQLADAIFAIFTNEHSAGYLKARVCLSAFDNIASYQLMCNPKRAYLNHHDIVIWLRMLVQICIELKLDAQLPDFQYRLESIEKQFNTEPIGPEALENASKLAQDCFDATWF